MTTVENLIKTSCFIIILLLTFSCSKDDNDVINPSDVEKWTYYNISNGLPSNQINCLAEDDSHNIWIGTNKGLAKFDGSNFTYYTTKTGLPSDSIYCLLWDRSSELIVGTQNGFGKLLSTGKFTDIYKFSNLSIVNFCQDKEYDCFYCATNIGLMTYYFTYHLCFFEVIDSTLRNGTYFPDPVYDITCDINNSIWVAGKKGIYEYVEEWNKIYYSNTHIGIPSYSLISCLFADKSGNVWIGPSADEKVMYYNGSNFINDTIFFGLDNYKAFAQDKYNNYWISIKGHGVLNYGGGMTKVYNTSNSKIVSDSINDILYDSKGNIWFGSNDNGLMYYQNIKPLQFEFDSGGNSKTTVNPIN